MNEQKSKENQPPQPPQSQPAALSAEYSYLSDNGIVVKRVSTPLPTQTSLETRLELFDKLLAEVTSSLQETLRGPKPNETPAADVVFFEHRERTSRLIGVVRFQQIWAATDTDVNSLLREWTKGDGPNA